MEPTVAISQRDAWGARGWRRRDRPHSWGRRSSLRALQARQEATTLSQVCSPPRDRGTTWSMFSAPRLQYWHRWRSRAKTARRDSGTRFRNGTRTKCTRRITEGMGRTARSEWSSPPLRATISALALSTRPTALRIGTTQSGSKLALSSSALPKRSRPPSPALAVRRQFTEERRDASATAAASPTVVAGAGACDRGVGGLADRRRRSRSLRPRRRRLGRPSSQEPEPATAASTTTREGIHLSAPFEVGGHVTGL